MPVLLRFSPSQENSNQSIEYLYCHCVAIANVCVSLSVGQRCSSYLQRFVRLCTWLNNLNLHLRPTDHESVA